MDEVLCDIDPLDLSDALLGQPFLWKRHAVYASRLRVVITTLGNKLYRISKIAPPTTISLVIAKQCSKLIAKTKKFVFLIIHPRGKKKIVATTSRQGPSARQQQMDKVMEEYEDILTSTAGVPLHCQVKHPIDFTLGASLPNGPIYRQRIHTQVMRASPVYNTATTGLSIDQPATSPFRWAWDSSHYVPLT
jgi:hypothetical protein